MERDSLASDCRRVKRLLASPESLLHHAAEALSHGAADDRSTAAIRRSAEMIRDRAPLTRDSIPAGAALRTALARIALDLQDARIAVDPGSLPAVFADAAQLANLFEVLLRNAIMHLPGGTVRVGVAQLPGSWMFVVSFARATENRAEDAGVISGLALAVCERIIHTHDGSYSIAQCRGGWEFRFRIPRGKASIAAR